MEVIAIALAVTLFELFEKVKETQLGMNGKLQSACRGSETASPRVYVNIFFAGSTGNKW